MPILKVGDGVLVGIVACDGRNKIADKWEDHLNVMLLQYNECIPVYKVKWKYGEGKCRTLDRNLLLSTESKFLTVPPPPSKPVRRKAERRSVVSTDTNETISISDSESEFFCRSSYNDLRELHGKFLLSRW